MNRRNTWLRKRPIFINVMQNWYLINATVTWCGCHHQKPFECYITGFWRVDFEEPLACNTGFLYCSSFLQMNCFPLKQFIHFSSRGLIMLCYGENIKSYYQTDKSTWLDRTGHSIFVLSENLIWDTGSCFAVTQSRWPYLVTI